MIFRTDRRAFRDLHDGGLPQYRAAASALPYRLLSARASAEKNLTLEGRLSVEVAGAAHRRLLVNAGVPHDVKCRRPLLFFLLPDRLAQLGRELLIAFALLERLLHLRGLPPKHAQIYRKNGHGKVRYMTTLTAG